MNDGGSGAGGAGGDSGVSCGFERRKAVWGDVATDAELRTSIRRCKCIECTEATRELALGLETSQGLKRVERRRLLT